MWPPRPQLVSSRHCQTGVYEALGVISLWGLVAAVVLDEFPALGLLNQKGVRARNPEACDTG